MSKAYQFPRDSGEPNPFADPEQSPGSEPTNPYGAPQGERAAVPAGVYEAHLPHRGTTILTLGILAVLGAFLAILAGWLVLPLGILNLALSIPAWWLGRTDRKAIKAGAMDPEGSTMTTAGWLLGLVTTWVTLLSVVAFVLLVIFTE